MEKIEELIDEKINDWDDCLNRHYTGEIQNSDVLIRAVLSDMEQLKSSLPKPVEVPEFVAEWYEEHRNDTLEAKFSRAKTDKDIKVQNWYNNCEGRHVNKRANAQEIIAKMTLYGYTVAKEPLYYVKFPNVETNGYDSWLMKMGDGTFELADNNDFDSMLFTEKEIKAIDERYWAFAVPVEEDAE